MNNIPEGYVQDKRKAEFMANAEDEPQTMLVRKLRGEIIKGDEKLSVDQLHGIIEESGKVSAEKYDQMREAEKELVVDNYTKEHPHAVVDEGEAMAMAEATKPEEEAVLDFKRSAETYLGRVGVRGVNEEEYALGKAKELVERAKVERAKAETKASQVSDVYKSIQSL